MSGFCSLKEAYGDIKQNNNCPCGAIRHEGMDFCRRCSKPYNPTPKKQEAKQEIIKEPMAPPPATPSMSALEKLDFYGKQIEHIKNIHNTENKSCKATCNKNIH